MTNRQLPGRASLEERWIPPTTVHRPELAGQPGDLVQFPREAGPVGAVPVGRADVVRAGAGHDALARRGQRAFGKMHQAGAAGAGLAHQRPHGGAAGPDLAGVTGVGEQRQLRRRHRHGPAAASELAARGGVGLAGLPGAGTDALLQVPVRGHHGLHVASGHLPAAHPRRAGGQYGDPSRQTLCLRQVAGAGSQPWRFGVSHARRQHRGQAGLPVDLLRHELLMTLEPAAGLRFPRPGPRISRPS